MRPAGRTLFAPGPHPLKGGGLLRPLAEGETAILGSACAGIDPFRTLGQGAAGLEVYLGRKEPGVFRYVIETNGELAGVLVLRWPWLRGPFIDMLTLLPACQGLGLGGAAVEWAGTEAARVSANLWATVSDFNVPARAFWISCGFAEIAELDGLIVAGRSEILLRRRVK